MNETIRRINELAKKQREQGLTEEEALEQKKLRQEYAAAFSANLRSQLDRVVLVDKDGTRTPLAKKSGRDESSSEK